MKNNRKQKTVSRLRAAGIPESAIRELYKMYACDGDEVLTHPDPKVEGTVALRVMTGKRTIDLLLVRGTAEFDEVEWETWPPKSGSLKFFV
jgi:hypothetical protein